MGSCLDMRCAELRKRQMTNPVFEDILNEREADRLILLAAMFEKAAEVSRRQAFLLRPELKSKLEGKYAILRPHPASIN